MRCYVKFTHPELCTSQLGQNNSLIQCFYHFPLSSSCSFLFNLTYLSILAEFGGYGNGRVRRRLSITQRNTSVTLPPNNRCWYRPPCKKLQPAWILPHGLLPRYNCSWSCHCGFQLHQHKEGSSWEMEG